MFFVVIFSFIFIIFPHFSDRGLSSRGTETSLSVHSFQVISISRFGHPFFQTNVKLERDLHVAFVRCITPGCARIRRFCRFAYVIS